MNQLRIDGTEVPQSEVDQRRSVGSFGLAAMAHIRRNGSITSSEAGRMVHSGRPKSHGDWWKHEHPTSRQCCKYAATDGSMAMRRLLDAGLVVRDTARRGHWIAVRR